MIAKVRARGWGDTRLQASSGPIKCSIGTEGKPGEGEVVAVLDAVELGPLQRAVYRLAGHRPRAFGVFVLEAPVVHVGEGERAPVYAAVEDAGGAGLFRLRDLGRVERRDGARGVKHGQRPAGDRVVKDTLLFGFRVRVGLVAVADGDGHDLRHRGQAVVRGAPVGEGLVVDVVVAGVRIAAVRSVVPRVAREHRSVRMGLPKLAEGDDLRRNLRQRPARKVADDRFAGELLPQRFGLAVVHHQIRVAEQAGDAEFDGLAVERTLEHEGAVAERTEGNGHGCARDPIVHDLVVREDLKRIGPRRALVFEQDHRLLRRHPVARLPHRNERGIVDRRDAVLRRPARHQRRKVDVVLRVRRVELLEGRWRVRGEGRLRSRPRRNGNDPEPHQTQYENQSMLHGRRIGHRTRREVSSHLRLCLGRFFGAALRTGRTPHRKPPNRGGAHAECSRPFGASVNGIRSSVARVCPLEWPRRTQGRVEGTRPDRR
ncbi:hypothetical protein SRU_0090 [Salinibacter ruber DSM 13855]|uniref:Uncharacterized protein n=1 Tax=Salinibacter ruber (strain DSM 13855 / M31) TaxID=309807 RepID=Q2S6D8_SALRD|nr:hypothetical protein SRU_0090 [Salinibacter ruber DSM 13855]